MFALLKQYFDIAFLMGKPQDLPAGKNQLNVAIMLNFVTNVMAQGSQFGIGKTAILAAIEISIASLFFYLALKFTSLLSRLPQALGALCGAGAVLNFAAVPILQLTQTPVGQEPGNIAVLSQFVLLVWSFSLVGHVLRHTFNIRMITSIVVSVVVVVLYYLFIISVFTVVFPPIGPSQGQ